jgi:asparagine synthase (glutamine-hydrolysing)
MVIGFENVTIMCGIFGHYSSRSVEDAAELQSRLLAAQRALHHRGPDDRGLEILFITRGLDVSPGSLALGHTRLSIIDLSSGGHQPMHSSDGRHTVVFNGEIYNYRELRAELKTAGYAFRTDSDTEVLLAAWAHWGISGLRRLTGMFAFAVYDRQDESLTLVRDAFGIKPLLYSLDEESFSFASEVPALLELLACKPDLDLQQAYDYLVYGRYDDQARTFYKGVAHLLPGHWLRVDLKTTRASAPERWWWPSIKERTDLSFEDAAAQLREMFLNSVRLHLRSDVPIGAALSGGLDSSAVVCAMRHLEPEMPIHTFTYVARGSAVDEERWADIVNQHVGAIAHKVVVEPQELGEDLDNLIRIQAEPFGTSSIYAQYRVFKLARECGISVILDGQGADESLGGYEGYPSYVLKELLSQFQIFEAISFASNWSDRFGRSKKTLLKSVLASFLSYQAKTQLKKIQLLNKRPPWIRENCLGSAERYVQSIKYQNNENKRYLADTLRYELTATRIRRLLRYEDRNSMAFSIESRVPFLTIGLVEFLLSLPTRYLVSSAAETKSVFRAAMRGIVPDEILDRRDKVGFDTPQHSWLKGQWQSIEQTIRDVPKDSLIDFAQAKRVIETGLESEDHLPEMWRIINYRAWLKNFA